MSKTSRQISRRLTLRRETVRQLDSIDPLELARVAGGTSTWGDHTMSCPLGGSKTYGKGSILC